MSRRLGISFGLLGLSILGCSTDPAPRPLGTDQFYRRDDRGGALVLGPRVPEAPLAPQAVDKADRQGPVPLPASDTPSPEAIDFVGKQVKSVVPTSLPAGSPVPAKPTEASFQVGQYVPVGAILAEVNGAPIYADDVVRAIAPLLAARAKDLDQQPFRSLASSEISRQVDDMIRAEVAFAAADRNTSAEDKKQAEKLTEQWRDRLKTENQGSIEEVRRKFREQGQTYDEAAKEQYRRNLVRVFYSKKLFPRIQVTADDLRRYYEQNRDSAFTQHDALTFRLIKITPQAVGTEAAARKKADDIAARAVRGEDFATLAGQVNNDPVLLRNKGLVGPVDRGAFRLDAVEQSLWPLSPGDVTPVIQTDGAYFIAKLENKTKGRVQSFDEDVVQQKMLEALRSEQFARMRRDLETQLRKDSVVSKNEDTLSTTLAMAMQNYPKWHDR